jgi:hypothetical protein
VDESWARTTVPEGQSFESGKAAFLMSFDPTHPERFALCYDLGPGSHLTCIGRMRDNFKRQMRNGLHTDS